MKTRLSIVTLSIWGLALLGCNSGADAGSNHSHTHGPVARGMQILLTVEELREASELVVKGSPTGRMSLQKVFADSPDYPEHLVTAFPDQLHNIEEISFRVDEYYKGVGPQKISVMMDADLADDLALEERVDYVLFLFRPDTAEGRAYWNEGYLVQGLRQGLWTVDGDRAVREVGDEKSLALTQFTETPATP